MKEVLLVGNPNVGKTTLFNSLTHSMEHTGNWHGVTVDARSKKIEFENDSFNIIDLPGIYSLTSFSFEEQTSINYIFNKGYCSAIVNVCDSNIIGKNLYLTLQLMEMNLSPILFLNFFDEAEKRGYKINYNLLSKKLGLTVISQNRKNKNNFKLQDTLLNYNRNLISQPIDKLNYLKFLPINTVLDIVENDLKQNNDPTLKNLPKQFIAVKLLEEDENIISLLRLSNSTLQKLKIFLKTDDYKIKVAEARYAFIDKLVLDCIDNKCANVYGKFKIDKIILNKYLCLPIFLCVIFFIFYITFSSVGAYLSNLLKSAIDNFIAKPVNNFLIKINSPAWIVGLFSSAIISGVGGLFSFIPQIVLLFLFLSILEDSGYMSRLAFSFEDLFYSIGLSGKSIFTIIMSFGCSTSAIMTARNIEDRNTKIKTAIISPYMSCSAKLPIYAVICGAFFSKGNILIIIGLYLIGIIVAILVSLALNKFVLKSGERSFILEFPPYRLPSVKRVSKLILENCKSFVIKVGTILLSFSVITWILQNFTFTFAYVPNTLGAKSMLQIIGENLAFLFEPIGLDNWGIVVSLLVGIMAKEMVVSTMAIINKIPNTTNFDRDLGLSLMTSGFVITLNPVTAIVMLLFSLLYFPCISTIGVMAKEIGIRYTILACLIQFSIAYLVCFVVYNFIVGSVIAKVIMVILFALLIIFSFICVSFKREKCTKCNYSCKNCSKIKSSF